MQRVHRVSVGLIGILIAALVLSSAPAAPALADACGLTSGAASVGENVCLDGRTVAVAPGPAEGVASGAHAGVTFVTFSVADVGAFSVVSRDGVGWSMPMPGAGEVRLRGSNAGADVASQAPYALLVLKTPMLPEWHAALAQRGVSVHAFVPENAFLVRASEGEGAVADLAFVDRMTALAPAAKVEPGLADEEGDVLVNVLTVPGAEGAYAAAEAALLAMGAAVAERAPEVERITVRVPAARVLDVAAIPDVMWVDRASLDAETDMNNIRVLAGAADAPGAPGLFRGQGVVGEVMDSGLETTHQDFDRLIAVDGSNSPHSHGTAVFGIVFGTGDGNGDAEGMAPEAEGVFAWYSSGRSRYSHAEVLASTYGGVFQTHSWGRGVPKDNSYDSYSNENDRVVHELDVLMLQSMSNCGPLCARREAMAKNIVSVGALYHNDNLVFEEDRWNSGFSRASTGPADDGRIKPELVGPYDNILTTTTGNAYTFGFGGTSGATPVVAGSVALANEMFMKNVFGGNGAGATASPATIKALLVASARPYLPHGVLHTSPANSLREPPQRDIQGWGFPNLGGLHAAGATSLVVDESDLLTTGDSVTYAYTPAAGAASLRVSLVWSDVPANPGATKTLVNDLDLEVRDPTGALVYKGNAGLRTGYWSTTGGDADRTNNHENVFVPAPVPGAYTITVRGAAVNLDAEPSTSVIDQAFGLVALSETA